jgi:ATP-dependent Clp endopeptidase proteolytic subunit ClpP
MTKVSFKNLKPILRVTIDNVDQETVSVLDQPIRSSTIKPIIARMQKIAVDKPKQNQFLVLNSGGGSLVDGMELVNTIRALKQREVKTTCIIISRAFSMAAMLQAFCHQTFALESAQIMFHQASAGIQGNEKELGTQLFHLLRFIKVVERQTANALGLSLKQYQNLRADEFWLTAPQAARLGFIDGIVDSFFYTATEMSPLESLFGSQQNENGANICQ